jgi:hypothetical protein
MVQCIFGSAKSMFVTPKATGPTNNADRYEKYEIYNRVTDEEGR